ncbi:MAG: response regulator transcription factor [Bacteroidota bacterium]
MIKVAIAEDHRIFQRGVELILEDFEDVNLALIANNGKDLIEKLGNTPVDIILMDLEMPEMDGIEATKYVHEHFPEIKIILLTMHHSDQYVSYMVELGVSAYLLKDEADPERTLYEAITTVVEKDFYFTPEVQQALLRSTRKTKPPIAINHQIAQSVTRREREVIELICKELSTQQMAEELYISPKTVETHRKNIREKLGVKGTAGIVIFAIQHGWFNPDKRLF